MADNKTTNTLDLIMDAYLAAAEDNLANYENAPKKGYSPVLRDNGRVRLFEALGSYNSLLHEYRDLMWPKENPVTGELPERTGRAFEQRRASIEKALVSLEAEIKAAGEMVRSSDRRLFDRTENLLAKTAGRSGSSERRFRDYEKEAVSLRALTASGTVLALRTLAKKERFENIYNRLAFLTIVTGPNYEALAEHFPQAYDSMHDYMGNLYDYASGKEMSEDESERRLDPVLEAFGYVEGFNYGLSLDDFEKSGMEDPSMRFAQNHSYHGKSISELQEYADEANVSAYRMWLQDAHQAVMASTPRREGESDRDFSARTLPAAAMLLSGRKPYGSWMAPYVERLGNMWHRLHLDPAVNARLYALATGGELAPEKKGRERKKAGKQVFAVGDIVITPGGESAVVSKVEDNVVTVTLDAGKTRRFDISRTELAPGVVKQPVKSGPPAGTPCLKESLEAAKAKLRHIRDVEIPDITEEMARARELGDLKENAEYHAAREKKSNLEKAAERLADQINTAVVLPETSDRFGKQFTYTDMETNKTEKVTLVGPWEADGKTLINWQSPLGAALGAMEKGETRSFGIGDGQRSIRLDDIGPSPSIPRAKLISAERFGEGIRVTEFKDKYEFLSNMYGKCSITAEVKDSEGVSHKVEFSSSEALYQASKLFYTGKAHTPTPAEVAEFSKFASMTGEEAKKAGGNIPIDKARWDSNRLAVMERCLNLKFQDPELSKKLAETGTKELSEGNVWKDSFWGVYDGKGENHLGKLLMKVREGLARQDTSVYHSNDTKTGLIMTGYFGRAVEYDNPVSVTRSSKIDMQNKLEELAPSWEILNRYKQDHDEAAYARAYSKQLDAVDWAKVGAKVRKLIEEGGPITLVCYEKPEDFCHRHMARERLEKEMERRHLLDGLEFTEKPPVQPELFAENIEAVKQTRDGNTIFLPENMDVRQSPEEMAKTQQAEKTMTAANDGDPAGGR